ncbi:hypothetical protein N431DRAFT_412639 [Stipitochalara longipes BDJ]|nr:hypothetical protein N431DRAFT_412639 [Stipitochalara longipes BDJ]
MANTKCCVCNASNSTLCSVCQSVAYCSDKCKQDDARTHKLLCKVFAAFDTKKRPTTGAVLALYFPILPYGEKGLAAPEIIWIDPEHEMHIVQKNSDGTIEYIDPLTYNTVEAEFTRDTSSPVEERSQEISSNYFAKFNLEHTIVLHMRSAFNFDGSRPNITLVEVTREKLHMIWKGPLVLYSKGRSNRDITVSDFRTFLDFCKVYQCSGGLTDALRTNNYIELELTNPVLFGHLLLHNSDHKTFKGVEITCEGDKKFLSTAQFLSVDVPLVHPIFDDVNNDNGFIAGFGATAVSKMIHLPLLVRRIFPDKRWNIFPQPKSNYSNPIAEYLNLNTDVSNRKWGSQDSGPYDGDGHIYGRVLVVREDKVDITAHQVEAVAAYFKKVFECLGRERFARFKGLGGVRLQEERGKLMDEHVSRAKFEAFWKEFKELKIGGGDASWKDEVLPYEIAASGSSGDGEDDGLEKGLDSLDMGSDSKPVE